MQMIGKATEFLRYYEADLTYNYRQEGVDTLNYSTCGTPYFDTEKEAEQYLADLSTTIQLLEVTT
jgi:hypothetical protein